MRSFLPICCAVALLVNAPPLLPAQASGQIKGSTQVIDAMRNHPLLVARQSLLKARAKVKAHKFAAAIPQLNIAAEALAILEQRDLGEIGREAGYTRQDIENYALSIQTDNGDALSRVDAWLNRIKLWSGGGRTRATAAPTERQVSADVS